MEGLRRRLPSPTSLVVFEAAGRLESFSLAADELGITQTAVSRQVRSLEDHLQTKLFDRGHKGVSLTKAGHQFFQSVSLGLEHIANSARDLLVRHRWSGVKIASTVAVVAFWLRPRIAQYMERYPNVDVHLIAEDLDTYGLAGGIDLLIRYGHGDWPDLESVLLFEENVYPVCSPDHAALKRVKAPEDICRETLLHFDRLHPDWIGWPNWFEHFGINTDDVEHGPHFNNYAVVVQSAVEGEGVALGWHDIVSNLIERRHLVPLLDCSMRTSRGYYLVWRRSERLAPQAEALRDWLVDNTRRP